MAATSAMATSQVLPTSSMQQLAVGSLRRSAVGTHYHDEMEEPGKAVRRRAEPWTVAVAGGRGTGIGPQKWQQERRGLAGANSRGRRRLTTAAAAGAAGSSSSSEGSAVAVPPRSVSVVLLAGGVGKRMGASMPKQYLPIFEQPIALYSFLLFASLEEVAEIIVVCDPSYRDIFQAVSGTLNLDLKFALPGKERQDSVYSGLQEIADSSLLVAVHDSARPLVTAEETRNVFRDGLQFGAAVLGVPTKATIKQANPDRTVAATLDRSRLWEMHTPQVMRPSLLREGFDLVQSKGLEVTDDVSIVEHLGHPVFITEGFYTNIKVTTPDDLLLAERVISQRRENASSILAV